MYDFNDSHMNECKCEVKDTNSIFDYSLATGKRVISDRICSAHRGYNHKKIHSIYHEGPCVSGYSQLTMSLPQLNSYTRRVNSTTMLLINQITSLKINCILLNWLFFIGFCIQGNKQPSNKIETKYPWIATY